MQLQELLFRSTPVAEGGVRGTSPRGCPIIDIPAFISNVMERYRRLSGSYVGRGGAAASNEALRTACREMVSLAHSWNEFQEESIAQYRCCSKPSALRLLPLRLREHPQDHPTRAPFGASCTRGRGTAPSTRRRIPSLSPPPKQESIHLLCLPSPLPPLPTQCIAFSVSVPRRWVWDRWQVRL